MVILRFLDKELLGNEVKDKYEKLIKYLKSYNTNVIIAFSGGIDSSFLAITAVNVLGNENVLLVTFDSPFMFRSDIEIAKRIARFINAKHLILKVSLKNPDIWRNPPNRCYLCKQEMFKTLLNYAKKVLSRFVVMDGTNADDVQKHRPGLRALQELGVKSPLAELGFTKKDVRVLAKELGLPNWNKPPSSCLATRIPYGELITIEKLRRIETAENIVKKIVKVELVRVRSHGNIARIEVDKNMRKLFFDEGVMDRIHESLRKLGYTYVTLDLYGYREGSMDESLR